MRAKRCPSLYQNSAPNKVYITAIIFINIRRSPKICKHNSPCTKSRVTFCYTVVSLCLTLLKGARWGRDGGRRGDGNDRAVRFAGVRLATPWPWARAGAGVAARFLALSIRVLALSLRRASVFGARAWVRWHFLKVGVGKTCAAVVHSLLGRWDGRDTSRAATAVALKTETKDKKN